MVLLPVKAGGKLLLASVTAVLVATLWLGSGVSLQVTEDRPINPEQIAKNLTSLGGGSETEMLQVTRRWRLLWWNAIIDYTVHGKYFWPGKGFGINLAYDDGIEPFSYSPTRSPHNGHLTVLARAGVPGMVLWILLQLGFAVSMLVGFVRARHIGQHTRASLFAWILGYWMAFMVNASFDVYLEGPQGGIWFWCVFGYGIALIVHQQSWRRKALRGGARYNLSAVTETTIRLSPPAPV
jgi:hypothetical protein